MIAFWLGLLMFCSFAWSLEASELEAHLIRVYSHVQKPDFDAPWSYKSRDRLTHMGIVVDSGQILVSAFAVTGAKHFEAEKLGDSRRYPMKLEFVDQTVDLALLRFVEKMPTGLKPIAIGGDLTVGAEATIYQGLEGESLVSSALLLREVEVRPIFISSYSVPHYIFELKRSGYGWFEPLIKDRKLMGAAIAQAGTMVYILPSSIIQRFLNAVRKLPYKGFAEMGFSIAPLVSPDQRKWAKADKGSSQFGAWIHSIKPSSPFAGKLQEGDVLMELNKTRVSSRGSYQHARWGRISIAERMSAMSAGDKVQLKILRDGKLKTLEAVAKSFDPEEEKLAPSLGQDPDYIIFGGLLMQELSKDLLVSWGPQWRKRAPLPYLYEEGFHDQRLGKERRVVLQRVFPVDFNKGYHDLEDNFVKSVNGREISDLKSVREALDLPEALQSGHARIQLEPEGDEVILSYQGIKQAHAVLQQRYGIPESAKFWQENAEAQP